MKNTQKTIFNIDWKKLQKQKITILVLIEKHHGTKEAEDLTGILHLLDAIQDSAALDQIATEEEIFAN